MPIDVVCGWAKRRRDRGRLAVDVDREHVHQRAAASARAVRGAEVLDERRRRVRRSRRIRVVAAARRQPAPDHGQLGVGVLERVIRDREQLLVRGRRGVTAARVELRRPEQVEVRLVADEDRPHRRKRSDESSRVGGERAPRCLVERRRGAELVDGELRLDALGLRRRHGAPQRRQVARGRRACFQTALRTTARSPACWASRIGRFASGAHFAASSTAPTVSSSRGRRRRRAQPSARGEREPGRRGLPAFMARSPARRRRAAQAEARP